MSDTARAGERVAMAALGSCVGRRVTVCGYIQALRVHTPTQVVVLQDSTGSVQVTNPRGTLPLVDQQIDLLTMGSAIELTGRVVSAPLVRLGGIEIAPESIDFASPAAQPQPLNAHSTVDTRLDWRFLDLRGAKQHLTFKVAAVLEHGMRTFLHARGFLGIHTPKVVPTASYDGPSFSVDYFGATAYLARSNQFYKQMAIAAGYDRVFEVGPAYRAERSFAPNHAAEFVAFDLEIAWIDSVEEVMHLLEEMLAYAIRDVHDALGHQIQEVFGVDIVVPSAPFPRTRFRDAEDLLAQGRWQVTRKPSSDFDPEEEQWLSDMALERAGNAFFFVTDFPTEHCPFYDMRNPRNPATTTSFDLISHGQRLATGAQHDHRYDVLRSQAASAGVGLDTISEYLETFRHGCPQLGGLRIGLARLVMSLLQQGSIRETTMFYRGMNRIRP
jgi:aspartyl-tRNA synthetase